MFESILKLLEDLMKPGSEPFRDGAAEKKGDGAFVLG
jgi:hypothetical protein